MSREIFELPPPPCDARLSYGGLTQQFVEMRRRSVRSTGGHPLAVMIHGGFWRVKRDLLYAGHACAALAACGFVTSNIEYRRVGEAGGGWPGTFDDVAAAVRLARRIAPEFGADAARTVVLGHSAGGHLALWMAAEEPALAGAISLGGVASLGSAFELHLGDDAVAELLGGTPQTVPERYAAADPARRASRVPRVLIHGIEDEVVPLAIPRAFMAAREAEGEPVRIIELPGVDHFDPMDPRTDAWGVVEREALTLAG